MKKLFAMLLAIVLVISLAACGGDAAVETTAPVADVPAEVSDPFDGLGDYTMILAHAEPDSSPRAISMYKFAEDVADATDGHVTVEVFSNCQLGTEEEILKQVVDGSLQGMRGTQYGFTPRLQMLSLPLLTSSRTQIDALLKSKVAQDICKESDETTGTLILGLCDAGGYLQFSSAELPIAKPEDLMGQTFFTGGFKTADLALQTLGAETISYSAGASGRAASWIQIQDLSLYGIQPYLTEINYQFHPDTFYVNAQWWNALPAKYQKIISACADDMSKYNDQLVDEMSANARQSIADAGYEIYVPTEEELAAFQNALLPVYDLYVAEGICSLEEIEAMREAVSRAG